MDTGKFGPAVHDRPTKPASREPRHDSQVREQRAISSRTRKPWRFNNESSRSLLPHNHGFTAPRPLINCARIFTSEPVMSDSPSATTSQPPAHPRVGLFATCLMNLFRPGVGFASVKLLEDAGCTVEVPDAQT